VSIAEAMNEAGDAVGGSTLEGDQVVHATLWGRHGITDLGAVGTDQCALAFSVNSNTQVVGISGPDCGFVQANAFLWERGGDIIDLNAFVPPDSDFHLRAGASINNGGEIAAFAADPDGNRRTVLLIPCDDEPVDSVGCRSAAQQTNVTSSPGKVPSAQPKVSPRDLLRGVAAGSHRYGRVVSANPAFSR
jgi:hypothetical protein